jgi:hypothetical protein
VLLVLARVGRAVSRRELAPILENPLVSFEQAGKI